MNSPVGQKGLIDFHPTRWDMLLHLFKLFFFAQRASSDSFPEQWQSDRALDTIKGLKAVLDKGREQNVIMTQPHMVLLDEHFYGEHIRPLAVGWLKMFLDLKHMGRQFKDVEERGVGLLHEEITGFLGGGLPADVLVTEVTRSEASHALSGRPAASSRTPRSSVSAPTWSGATSAGRSARSPSWPSSQ